MEPSTKFKKTGRTNKTQQSKIVWDRFVCNMIEYNKILKFGLFSKTFAPFAMPNTLCKQNGEKFFATVYLKKE